MTTTARLLLILATAAVIAGCDMTRIACKPDTVDVHVAAECESTCSVDAPLNITEDMQSVVDALMFERGALKQCELKRRLCVAAIDRARDAKAIK